MKIWRRFTDWLYGEDDAKTIESRRTALKTAGVAAVAIPLVTATASKAGIPLERANVIYSTGKWVEIWHDGIYSAIHANTGWYFQQNCSRGQYAAARRNRDRAWHVTLAKQLNIESDTLSIEDAVRHLDEQG